MKIDVTCHQCKKAHVFDDLLPFRAECDACSADLHVCITCRFYDRYVENECREDQAEYVAVKDRRNLCEYWKPRADSDDSADAAAEAKRKLAALFSGGGASPQPDAAPLSPAEEAKQKLEALFKKKS